MLSAIQSLPFYCKGFKTESDPSDTQEDSNSEETEQAFSHASA